MQDEFSTIETEGILLPPDFLARISKGDKEIEGLRKEDYHLSGDDRLADVISQAWNRAKTLWSNFKKARENLPESDKATTVTRERWLLPLFQELGYGRLVPSRAQEIEGKSYPVSHIWQRSPIHLIGCRLALDERTPQAAGAARMSPHSMVQEFLNRSDDHLWGFVSNGLTLRILRDNASITRQAYVEFDLQAMLEEDDYSDFSLFWLLCHQSRVEGERPEQCWLEKWSKTAQKDGTRVLEDLRIGVEQAIVALGCGFLAQPANNELKEKLRTGALDKQEYYHQLLRTVYRLIFLFVAEDRGVLLDPNASHEAQRRYEQFYSTGRLRKMAGKSRSTKHHDLWESLALVIEKLHSSGCVEIGLPALGSFLWSSKATPDLSGCKLQNQHLLDALRHLSFTEDATARVLRTVDYKNLGAEEFGSVYEALLELHPEIHADVALFELKTAAGHERKTTGSYYTPTSLITCLLDSALEPALDKAAMNAEPEKAILNLKVCDPACGSGHFLVAAGHRIAKRLARARTGDEEPSPEATRKALRDVIGHCIYGVDSNPWAVELCKFSLWLEAIEPGKPMSFLEHHIQHGNSLLGATPALLQKGIPEEAFEAIMGDDKKYCAELKKKNKTEHEEKGDLFDAEQPWNRLGDLATAMHQLDALPDDTPAALQLKQDRYESLVKSTGYESGRLWADAWCAAFIWKKVREQDGGLPFTITEQHFRKIERNPHSVPQWMKEEVIRLSNQYNIMHWHLAFPEVYHTPSKGSQADNALCGWSGGFDVVLGNPPWDVVAPEEQEFFSRHAPNIVTLPSRAKRLEAIKKLELENPQLARLWTEEQRKTHAEAKFYHLSNAYPLSGTGNLNTFALFLEKARMMLRPGGTTGLVVPSSIAFGEGTKSLFNELVKTGSLSALYDFENREQLFAGIDSRFKFCLLTLTSSRVGSGEMKFGFFLRNVQNLQEPGRVYALTAQEISAVNPNSLTAPTFPFQKDRDLVLSIYQRVPIFQLDSGNSKDGWQAECTRMVDMSYDSEYFESSDGLEKRGFHREVTKFVKGDDTYLPVYEAKMINQYNHRSSDVVISKTAQVRAAQKEELDGAELLDPIRFPEPRFWMPPKRAFRSVPSWYSANYFIAFTRVTSPTNARTTLASIIPYTPAGHSLGIVYSKRMEGSLGACIVACLNSFVLDYVCRQKIGGINLNPVIVHQLPIIDRNVFLQSIGWCEENQPLERWIFLRVVELTYTSFDVEPFANAGGYSGPPFKWEEERRFILQCELDAAYFHLYGISRDDTAYILDTFPIVKRKEVVKHGEYRTQRVILEIYDELKKAMETGVSYQTRLDPPPADPRVAHPPKMPIYTKVQVERGKVVAYITLLLHICKKRVARDVLDTWLVLLLNDDIRKSLAGKKGKLDSETKIAQSLDSTLANMKANGVVQIEVSGTQQHIVLGKDAQPLSKFPSSMQDCAKEAIAVYLKLRDADQLAYLERVLNDKSVLVQDGAATV